MHKLSFLQLSSLLALCGSLLFSGAVQADRSYVGSSPRHADRYYNGHPGKGYKMPPGQYKKYQRYQKHQRRHEHRERHHQPYYPEYPRAHHKPRYVQPAQPGIHIILPFENKRHHEYRYEERSHHYVAPRR